MGIHILFKGPGHILRGHSLSEVSFPVSQRQLKKENVLLENTGAWDILPPRGQQDCRRAADGAVACSVTARRVRCQRTEWQ